MKAPEENTAMTIAAWARAKPMLKRLWLHGSRVSGSPRQDSDLDIAFEIDPLTNDETKAHFWDHVLPSWRAELQELSPYQVHLEALVIVEKSVNEGGKKIYERA